LAVVHRGASSLIETSRIDEAVVHKSFQVWLEFGEALDDSHPVFNGSDPLQGGILWPADRLRVYTEVDTSNLRKASFLYDVLVQQTVIRWPCRLNRSTSPPAALSCARRKVSRVWVAFDLFGPRSFSDRCHPHVWIHRACVWTCQIVIQAVVWTLRACSLRRCRVPPIFITRRPRG